MPYTVHSMCGVGLIAPLRLAFMIFSLNSGIPMLLGGIGFWFAFLPCALFCVRGYWSCGCLLVVLHLHSLGRMVEIWLGKGT